MSCLFSFLLWGINLNNMYCLGKNDYVSIFREQRRRRKQRQSAPNMPCGVLGAVSEKKNIKNTSEYIRPSQLAELSRSPAARLPQVVQPCII